MTELDTVAATEGATHKDALVKGRYYRLNIFIGHVDRCDQDKTMTKYNQFWNWRYFGSKLPASAVPL